MRNWCTAEEPFHAMGIGAGPAQVMCNVHTFRSVVFPATVVHTAATQLCRGESQRDLRYTLLSLFNVCGESISNIPCGRLSN